MSIHIRKIAKNKETALLTSGNSAKSNFEVLQLQIYCLVLIAYLAYVCHKVEKKEIR